MPATQFIRSVLLVGALAVCATEPARATPPGDTDPKDVTITVVNDPEQLNEKVNRISLPPVEVPPHALPKPEKNADPSKEAHGDREPTAHEASGAEQGVSDSSKSDAESVKQDTPEAPPQDPGRSGSEGGD